MTENAAFPARVHFDFNDLGQDGSALILQRHLEAGREAAPGDPVLLLDCEGNSMYGHVTEADAGKVIVSAVAGSWRAGREPLPPRVTGWRCAHLTMTATDAANRKVVTWCGCDMQPIYLSTEAA